MRRLLFLLLPIVLLSSRCKKETPPQPLGDVKITFKSFFNNTPLIMNKVYDYGGKSVRFTRLSFYTSEILMQPQNLENELQVIRILKPDFTNLDTELKAAEGVVFNLKFRQDSYSNLVVNLGISSTENAKKPKDFETANPLSNTSDYWDSWNSYIFSKLEGLMDKDGDGKFETGITLHTGGNEVYQTLKFNKSFAIKSTETATVNFDVDVNKLLKGIDLANINSTHQTGDLPTMKLFMSNFKEALTIK
jgi:hypothetical protein